MPVHEAMGVRLVLRTPARDAGQPPGGEQPQGVPPFRAPPLADPALLQDDVLHAVPVQGPAHGQSGLPTADDDGVHPLHVSLQVVDWGRGPAGRDRVAPAGTEPGVYLVLTVISTGVGFTRAQ